VGYSNAAANIHKGITRSNFQYSQILASGGIVLFIIYFYFIFCFICRSIKLVRNDQIVFSLLLFILLEFTFRRPESYFSILGYIVVCREYFNIKSNINYEKNNSN